MNRILFFGFTDFALRMKASALKQELEKMGCECFLMDPACCGQVIGGLVFNPTFFLPAEEESRMLEEPFILFCGLQGEVLDTALAVCRGYTRAILTPSNAQMTPYQLSAHLLAEKEEMRRRQSLRKRSEGDQEANETGVR